MKLFVVVVLLLLLPLKTLVSGDEEAQPPALLSRWDLIEPDLFFCSDGADFVFRYSMSDLIEDDMVDFELFRPGCEINIWSNNYMVPKVERDLAPLGNGGKVRQMLVALQPNINLLAVSPVYSVSEDGSTGTIAFCIKASVYTKDRESLVNYKEIEYAQETVIKADVRRLDVETNSILETPSQNHRRLNLDCSNGFDIVFENWWSTTITVMGEVEEVNITNVTESDFSIVVASKKELSAGENDTSGILDVEDWSFLLLSYQCDENNNEITTPTAFNQGDTIRICIEPDQEAKDTGLVMSNIDTLYFTRGDIPSIYQYAVEGGQPDFYGMSELFCDPGSVKCAVETTIRSEFFASSGMITATGTATFEWNWENGRRHLQEDNERDLQEAPGVDSIGRFALNIPLKTFQETMDIKMKGPSYLQSFLLIVLSFTFVLATLILFWIRDIRRSAAHIKDDLPAKKKDLTETVKTTEFHYDDDDYNDDDDHNYDDDKDYCVKLRY